MSTEATTATCNCKKTKNKNKLRNRKGLAWKRVEGGKKTRSWLIVCLPPSFLGWTISCHLSPLATNKIPKNVIQIEKSSKIWQKLKQRKRIFLSEIVGWDYYYLFISLFYSSFFLFRLILGNRISDIKHHCDNKRQCSSDGTIHRRLLSFWQCN